MTRRTWLQLLGLARFMPQLPAPAPTTLTWDSWDSIRLTLDGVPYSFRAITWTQKDGWNQPIGRAIGSTKGQYDVTVDVELDQGLQTLPAAQPVEHS